jgi:hypothetical protein
MSESGYDPGKVLSAVGSFLEKSSELPFFDLIAIAFFLLDNCLLGFRVNWLAASRILR